MDIDPTSMERRNLYQLLISCVVPRPIAWISTQDAQGTLNLAPYSFFNAIGANPPALMFSSNYSSARQSHKDTLQNILASGEFVVNIVTEAVAEAMNLTSGEYGAEVDEFDLAQLTAVPSTVVQPPRVAESPINLECELHRAVPVGEGPGHATVVIGLIKHMHIRDELFNEQGRVDIHRLQPIGRLGGLEYCSVRDIFEMQRP